MRRSPLTQPIAALLLVWLLPGATSRGTDVDFNRDVQPILSAHCYKCHGPDESSRQAGLRLDERDAATSETESGVVPIRPGRPDESELVRRLVADDDERMPPPEANKPLTPRQQQILREWVAAGAQYEPHWAFVPPARGPLPEVRQADWPRGAIDRFVLARLEAAGLSPSPEADRDTLARRVALDLTGLPPTPDELAAFLDDPCEDAYERYVDRLLASPHYGERWARRWLDLARYADTNGYEKDRVRSMWPYRDWVIRALNDDLPFDRFTVEQLAGDLLPGATIDQRIATGFHRNTMINEEGGIDPLEFRFHAMIDRVNTTGTVWLGLTVGCAQCHSHKYDPLPQADYYRLLAFLNNADEPVLKIPDPDVAAQRSRLEARIAELEAALPDRFPVPEQYRWHEARLLEAVSAEGAELAPLDDGSLLAGGANPEEDVYTLVVETDAAAVAAIRLEALTHDSLGGRGPGRTEHGNFVLSRIALAAAPAAGGAPPQDVPLVRAEADFSQSGFTPEGALDGEPRTGWAIAGQRDWNVDRAATFYLAEPRALSAGTRWTIRLEQNYGGRHTLGRFRLRFGEPLPDQRSREVRRTERLQQQFAEWLAAQRAATIRWTPLVPEAASSQVPTLALLDDGSILASGDQTKRDVYHVRYACDLPAITAIRLEVLADERLPEGGPGRVAYEGPLGDFFLSELRLACGDAQAAFAEASHSFAGGENSAAAAIDGNPHTGWSINGGQGRDHTAVFRLAEPLTPAGMVELELVFERYYAAGLGRFRLWATSESNVPPARDLPTRLEPLLAAPGDPQGADREALLAQFLAQAPQLAAARAEIEQLRKSLPADPTTLVMCERPAENPRTTHVHKRGEFLQPGEAVTPALPEIFRQLTDQSPTDRLSFARWLASADNPLVARVTVNRQWAVLLGRGLVRTTEDFGYQGERPTHPELLDWLALEFIERGWSLKALHRLIVTSATYRQSAAHSPELAAADPENLLLGRGARVRLDAELVRDAALSASGLLSRKVGGPSVFPPQPEGVSSEGAYGPLKWVVSAGDDRYRRGLYTFAKRTAPYAMFTTFDAPSGEACLARREVSNTPLQALTLLNDEVFVEAARALGRALAAAGDDAGRLDQLYLRCLSRLPAAAERRLFAEFLARQRARLAAGALDAAAIAGPGAPEGSEPLEQAAWTLAARAVLNLDEFVVKP